MKMNILKLDGTPEELKAFIADFDFEEFRVIVRGTPKPEVRKSVPVPEPEPTCAPNPKVEVPELIQEEQQCRQCGKPARDPYTYYCSEDCRSIYLKKKQREYNANYYKSRQPEVKSETPLPEKKKLGRPKMPQVIIAKTPRPVKEKVQPTRGKIDLSENGVIVKPPANLRPPIVLKSNERLCALPSCHKIFVIEKFGQECCSLEHEEALKKSKVRGGKPKEVLEEV